MNENHAYSAGAIIVNPKGYVVVVNQNGRSWSLPKGHIEKNEDAKTAAIREVEEETGITQLEFVADLGSYDRYRIGKDGDEDQSELKTITMFLCKTNQKHLQPTDPENPEARWVKPDQVADLLTHAKDKEFFLKALPMIQQTSR